jgi:excisionase family DNA binding protein
MSTFLTTHEMEDLLAVDRSTIYRMAEDGRLPGVKVGRQWRFPADRITRQLGLEPVAQPSRPLAAETGEAVLRPLSRLLVPEAVRSLSELLGDLFEVMAVVTDLDGTPLTPVANPCGFYAAIADVPGATDACLAGWRQLAAEPSLVPRFVTSHLGFLCARTFVWVDLRPVGMVVVGGVTPPNWPPAPESIEGVADEIGVPLATLEAVLDETWDVSQDRQDWILRMLPKIGDVISQLASARSQLLARLDAIAELADADAPRISGGSIRRDTT